MPLDPNHIHTDTPHAKTVHLASQGWRYGCHSARTGDDKPRGGQTRYARASVERERRQADRD